MRKLLLIPIAVALLAIVLMTFSRDDGESGGVHLITLQPGPVNQGFQKALAPIEFQSPADHGPHPAFQTEWWYYTGTLRATSGERFGYQLTFFRRGLSPEPPSRTSTFAAHQIYFAHFAITYEARGQHVFAERIGRGALDIAGAQSDPLRVWIKDWSLESQSGDGQEVRLTAKEGEHRLDLQLSPIGPLIPHGESGLSTKGKEPGNASYYFSYPRMMTIGELEFSGERFIVEGESWFDHEWSTSALGEEAVGWDWFGLRLGNDTELMMFRIRTEGDAGDPLTGGTLIRENGEVISLQEGKIRFEEIRQWESPHTGALYPVEWIVQIPSQDIDLRITPWIMDQEMVVGFQYWEGAVSAEGTVGGRLIIGTGYMELTGYGDSMKGIL